MTRNRPDRGSMSLLPTNGARSSGSKIKRPCLACHIKATGHCAPCNAIISEVHHVVQPRKVRRVRADAENAILLLDAGNMDPSNGFGTDPCAIICLGGVLIPDIDHERWVAV